MAQEELTITFYKIQKCGYYKNGNHKFGNITETLNEINNWATHIGNFVDTKLWDIEKDGEKFNDVRQTYFYKYEGNPQKDSLLVLWNEIPDVKGAVPTLRKDKKINDNTLCEMTDLPKNAIPGTASYFWFLADKGYCATICRKGRSLNNREMCLYLKRFLETASSHCVTVVQSDGAVITGYRNGSKGTPDPKIVPYFKVSRASRKGVIEYIQENCERIRKIIRKQAVSYNTEIQVDVMKKILIELGIKRPIFSEGEINTRYEINYTPTEEELNDIIHKWRKENVTKYDDTGFVFKGESDKIHWLSEEISRTKKLFDLTFIDKEIINPFDLLQKLEYNKAEIISVLEIE